MLPKQNPKIKNQKSQSSDIWVFQLLIYFSLDTCIYSHILKIKQKKNWDLKIWVWDWQTRCHGGKLVNPSLRSGLRNIQTCYFRSPLFITLTIKPSSPEWCDQTSGYLGRLCISLALLKIAGRFHCSLWFPEYYLDAFFPRQSGFCHAETLQHTCSLVPSGSGIGTFGCQKQGPKFHNDFSPWFSCPHV